MSRFLPQRKSWASEPISAYEIATNKFKTSIFEGRKSFKASNVEEALHIARTEDVPWPIIIKPCRGWASELVFKVDNVQQLEEAAPRMRSDRHGTEFVMEHYCDGPEVDINFVMYDGDVIFWGMHFPPFLSFAKANMEQKSVTKTLRAQRTDQIPSVN
jgi:D-alanine-D-alanine ligase-like ATP-grasp enzyme